MLRKQTRLRKEYLYRKSLEGKEKLDYERRRAIKRSLNEGTPIPTELRGEEREIRREIENHDDNTFNIGNSTNSQSSPNIDDEYGLAGIRDPKVLVTTSRDPSSRLKQFAKEIKLLFPNSTNVNRGNTKVKELVESSTNHDFTDIVVLTETRGEPDGLYISHLPLGPTAYFTLSNAVLRHDIQDRGTVSEQYPHIILEGFSTRVGQRLSTILRHLFPPPRPESKRILTFKVEDDVIIFRHHTYERNAAGGNSINAIDLQEVGPRFIMQPYMIRLGTIDQEESEKEWVYRPYLNTAKKSGIL